MNAKATQGQQPTQQLSHHLNKKRVKTCPQEGGEKQATPEKEGNGETKPRGREQGEEPERSGEEEEKQERSGKIGDSGRNCGRQGTGTPPHILTLSPLV